MKIIDCCIREKNPVKISRVTDERLCGKFLDMARVICKDDPFRVGPFHRTAEFKRYPIPDIRV